jgi:hypothetical protein
MRDMAPMGPSYSGGARLLAYAPGGFDFLVNRDKLSKIYKIENSISKNATRTIN